MWDDDLKDKSVTESSPEPRKNSTASKSILRRGISEVITGALKKDQQGHRLEARKSKAQMFAVSRSPRAAKLVVIVIGLAPNESPQARSDRAPEEFPTNAEWR